MGAKSLVFLRRVGRGCLSDLPSVSGGFGRRLCSIHRKAFVAMRELEGPPWHASRSNHCNQRLITNGENKSGLAHKMNGMRNAGSRLYTFFFLLLLKGCLAACKPSSYILLAYTDLTRTVGKQQLRLVRLYSNTWTECRCRGLFSGEAAITALLWVSSGRRRCYDSAPASWFVLNVVMRLWEFSRCCNTSGVSNVLATPTPLNLWVQSPGVFFLSFILFWLLCFFFVAFF